MTVLITTHAMQTMCDVVSDSPVETGGVMVGYLIPVVVVAAGGPGPRAVREPTRFSGDPEEDHRCLDEARRTFGEGVVVLGYYHLHPPGMDQPSATDLHQARELLAHFADDKVLLVGIFTQTAVSRGPLLFLYTISRSESSFTRVEFDIITASDAVVAEARRRSPAVIRPNHQGFWDDIAFRFIENPVGKAAIQRDMAHLRDAGWTAHLTRSRANGHIILLAKRD